MALRSFIQWEKNIPHKELTLEAEEKLEKEKNNEDASSTVLIAKITEDAFLP